MKTFLQKTFLPLVLILLLLGILPELRAQNNCPNDIGINNNLTRQTFSICKGDNTVEITGNALNGVAYNWEVSTTNSTSGFSPVLGSPNQQNYSVAFQYYNTPGTYYFRRILNKGGCQISDVAILTVNAPPTPTISVTETAGNTPNDGISCSESPVTLTAGGGTSYQWQHGSTTAATTVTPTATTTYLVKVTDANNCSATTSKEIIVNPIPTPVITVTESSGTPNDNTVCSGATATLTASGGSSYTWMPGNQSGNPIQVQLTNTTTYEVTATNTNGCKEKVSKTISVTPLPTLTTAGSLAPVCRSASDQTTTLSYTTSTNNPISYSIDWNNAANIDGLADQGPTVFSFDGSGGVINNIIVKGNTKPGSYNGILTLTNANGCTNSQAVSLTVNVSAAPTIAGATASTTPFCSGQGASIFLTGLIPNLQQTVYYSIEELTGTHSVTITSNSAGEGSFTTIPLGQNNSGKKLSILAIARNDIAVSCTYNPPTPTVVVTLPLISGELTAPGLSYSPGAARICAGLVITVNITAGTGGAGTVEDQFRYKTPGMPDWSAWSINQPPTFTTVPGSYAVESRRTATGSTCVVSGSNSLSWVVIAQPTVSDISPSTQIVCQDGTAKQLNVSATGGTGNFTYEWYMNTTNSNTGGTLVSGPTPFVSTFTPPTAVVGTRYYYAKVIQSGANCGPIFSEAVAVTVIEKPVAGVLVKNPAVAEVCPGTPVSATLTPGAGGGTTASDITEYSYDATGIWIQYTPGDEISTAGHTRIQIRTARKSPETGCVQSAYNSVEWSITPPPNGTITVSENSGTANNDGALCAGGSATLTTAGGATYLWSTGETTPSIVVEPTAASTTYQVTVTDAKGCSSVFTKAITVSSIPSPSITSTESSGTTPNDGAICNGAQVTLKVTGGTAYQWVTTNQSGSTISVSPTTTTEYIVTVDNAGCSSTDKYTVYVNPLPTPAIAVTETSGVANDSKICPGTSVTLTASGGTTYLWNTNAATNTLTIAPTANTTYSVKVTDDNGCFQPQNTSITITVIPNPTITTNGVVAPVCPKPTAQTTSLAYSATSSNPISYSIDWDNAANGVGLADQANTPFAFAAGNGTISSITIPANVPTGSYAGVLTLTNANNCTVSQAVTFVVHPVTTITTQPTGGTYCQNTTATALGVAASGAGTLTYQWYKTTTNTNSGGTLVGSTASYIPPTNTAGTAWYYVIVTGTCGTVTSNAVSVVVNPATSITAQTTPAAAYCQNATNATELSVTAAGTGTLTYQWYRHTSASNSGGSLIAGANGPTYIPPTTTPGTSYYYVVVTGSCSTATSAVSGAIVVNPLPTITVDAKASLACRRYPNYSSTYLTSTLGFSGNTGNQYSITWDAAGKAAGLTDVAYTSLTATSGNITIQTPDIKDGGIFTGTVTVKTAAGCTSEPKTFTLEIATHTIAGPGGLTTFCFIDSKTPVQFDMTGSIPGYTYFLWDINVGTNDPQGQHSLKPPDNGGKPWNFTMFGQNKNWCYQVAAVSPDGCITVSNLICPTLPPETNINSAFASCGPNSTATITASITGAKTVEWEYNDGSGWKTLPTGSPYSVSTSPASSTLTISPVTQAMNGWQYRIKSTGNGPCGGDFYSSAATLTYAIPITGITKNTPPTTYCYGTTASPFTVSIATGNGISYQWYSNTTNSTTGGTLLQGETGSSYTPPTTAQSGLYYYVRVTNVCGTQTAIWGPVVINPLTQITTQPVGTGGVNGSGLYCENGTIAPLTVNATGTTPLVYQWYRMAGASPAPATDPKVGTNSNSFVPPATEGTNNYYVVVSGGCDSKQSNVVPVTVVKPFTLSQLAPPTTPCYQSTVTLRITASVPANVQSYQWYKNGQPITTNGNGATYTITSFTPAENGEYYVVVTGKAPCSESLTSNKITLTSYTSDFTTWTSGAGTDEWHEELNWTCGIPNLYRDALIPIVSNNKYPYVDNAPDTGGKVRNMIIEANGPNLRIDGILKIAGNVTNNGKIDAYLNGTASTGTIEFVSNLNYYGTSGGYPDNGNNTTPLTLSGSAGTHDTRTQHLKISNRVNFTIPVDVYGQLSFAGINRNLNTGDALTLKSVSSTISAMVKDRTNESGNELNNIISGQVTVERFIDGAQGRKWRLVTAPVKGININQGWQDGMTMANGVHKTTTTGATATPTSKYGTLITGGGLAGQTPAFTTAAAANAAGFDFWDAIAYAQSSIRYYAGNADYTAAIWQPVVSTTANNFDANQAYLLFVRGDRSITTTSGGTTLRPKGLLKENLSHSFTVNAVNSHTLVGNPFASPLNFHKIYQANQSAIQPYFWIWQASLTASWGGYALIRPVSAGSTNYEMVPDGSMTGIPASPIISSGQGFFVVPVNKTTNGTVTIHQTHKDANNSTVSVYREADNKPKKLFANVYIPETTGQDVLLDGILAEYESGTKSSNLAKPVQNGENLSIYRNGRDQILVTSDLPKVGDTLHLRLWNTTARSYRLRIRSANFAMPGVTAVLVDNFLAKETPITMGDGITTYDFRVTGDAASKEQRRFIIVFQRAPLPAITLDGAEKRNGIALNWKVPEDMNVARYELERSTDGTTYKELATTAAKRNAAPQQYSHTDIQPAMTNHYRVKMTGITGAVAYSNTVIVELKEASGLTIYPNPVTGTTASLQFTAKPQGRYNIVVYAPTGQQVASQVVQHNGGTATYGVSVGSLASGSYTLEVWHPDNRKEKIRLIITH